MSKYKIIDQLTRPWMVAALRFALFLSVCLYALWSMNDHKPLTLSAYIPLIVVCAVITVYMAFAVRNPFLSNKIISYRLEDIEKKEKRYRAIVDALPDMVFVVDKNGRYIDFNDAAGSEPIVNPEEFISKKIPDVLPPQLAGEVMIYVNKVLTTMQPIGHHYQLDVKGEMRSFESRYVPHGDENIMIIVRDMTDVKTAERRIIESENKYRTLVEQGTESIFIANFQGNILVVNPAACELTQYSETELLRMRIHDLASPEELLTRPIQLAEVTSGKTIVSERNMKRKDDELIAVEIAARMIAPNRLLAFVRDITERKKTEHELIRSSEDLRQLNSYIENVREAERMNVSREIHDDLGQQLAVLRMDLSRLAKKFPQEDMALVREMSGLLDSTSSMIGTVRRIAQELRPSMLDDIGLMATLDWYCVEFSKRTGIGSSFGSNIPDDRLSKELNVILFRIIQESLVNIASYSGATKVDISICSQHDQVILLIEDNGKDYVHLNKGAYHQLPGFRAMRERARMANGSCDLHHHPTLGTVITVTVPLNSSY